MRKILACALLAAGSAYAQTPKPIPECAHWTVVFVFREFMDLARVNGAKNERLRLRRAHPLVCESPDADCAGRAYLIPGDQVTVGNRCEGWAYVQYEAKRSRSMGWVETTRLDPLPPTPVMLAQRKKWQDIGLMRSEREPMLQAAREGDAGRIRSIAASDREAVSKTGMRALYMAARQRHMEAVRALLDVGSKANEGAGACHAFMTTLTDTELPIAEVLIRAGADVNCSTQNELLTPLMWIARQNRAMAPSSRAMGSSIGEPPDLYQLTKLLLASGAAVDAKDSHGRTALRHASQSNNVDIAQALLDAKADVNNYIGDATSIGEQQGHTILMEAIDWYALRWDPTMLALLLKRGADVNYRSPLAYDDVCDKTTSGKCTFRGQTALTRAATQGYNTVVRLLLDHGADPSLPRSDGMPPAAVAREFGHPQTAELIERHARRK